MYIPPREENEAHLQTLNKEHAAPSTERPELQQESFWSCPQALAELPAPPAPVCGLYGMAVRRVDDGRWLHVVEVLDYFAIEMR